MFLFYQPSALRCCIYLHTRFRRSCCWPRLTLLSAGLATRRSRLDEQDEQRTGDITTPRRKVRPAQVSLGVLPSPLFFSSSFWLQVFFSFYSLAPAPDLVTANKVESCATTEETTPNLPRLSLSPQMKSLSIDSQGAAAIPPPSYLNIFLLQKH